MVEGWFTVDDEPRLIGAQCPACDTIVFPPREGACPNPACESEELNATPLSRRGRVWSYTENHYPPPPPYVASDPFEPYALAAVELADEGIVVLGQLATGTTVDDVKVGSEVELVVEPAYELDGDTHLIYRWKKQRD